MASAKPKGGLSAWFGKGPKGDWVDIGAVSYTHLTLPTICSV